MDELILGIDRGTVRLPDIQRPFVWPNAKVRDLVDSMYRGYPVGELMFWASNDDTNTKIIGDNAKTQDVSMQVVDGQQRLTSLFAVIKGLPVWREDYSRESIRLAFNPLTERFDVPTAVIRRQAEWIADIRTVFQDPIQARHDYLDRLRVDGKHPVDSAVERAVEMALQRVAKLREYPFQVVQIKEEVGREVVADIFVRTNSEGVSLAAADFILTWMSVFWEDGRDALEVWARNSRFTPGEVNTILGESVTWTPHNPYIAFDPGQVLRVAIAVGLRRAKLQDAYNVLRGRDPHTRVIHPERREAELSRLKQGQAHATRPLHWDEFLKVLERAGFRTREMVSSSNTLLYTYALWIIGRVDFGVPVDELREVMARWFFMAQITGRYTSSPETRMQEDLNRLDGAPPTPDQFIAVLNAQITSAVPDDWWRVTLIDNLDTSSSGAPAYLGYLAALNILDADVLLATSKVKDWINPSRRPVKGIERHHLFPKDYLRNVLDVSDTRRINQVANFALVEWSDNINISNAAPVDYWPEQVAKKAVDAARRTRQEQWHALPANWTDLPYSEFLAQRRVLMANVIHEGFKRLTDPSYEPDLSMPATPIGASAVELPTLEGLVLAGALPPGTLLTPTDPARPTVAEVTEDGQIQVGEHLCETVERAAREDNADPAFAWDYWQAHLDDLDDPVTLAELRERAVTASD